MADLSFARRFFKRPALYIPALFVPMAGAVALVLVRQAIDSSRDVVYTDAVLLESQRILTRLIDSETGERGYLITGHETYLEPYRRSMASMGESITRLRRLTRDDFAQTLRIDTLARLRTERLAVMDSAIRLRQQLGIEAAARYLGEGEEKRYTDALRALLDRIQADEIEARDQQLARHARIAGYASWAVALGFLSALAAALFLNYVFEQIAERRRESAEKLAATAEELRREQQFLQAVLNSMQDGVIAADAEHRMQFINPAAKELVRSSHDAPRDEWAAGNYLRHPDGRALEPHEVPLTRALAGETVVNMEVHSTPPNGASQIIIANAQPIRSSGGDIAGAVVVLRDETQARAAAAALKQTEEQLRQAHKMEAIGQLAGGIAHDFNNILTAIIGTADLALMSKEVPTQLLKDLGDIRDAAMHAAAVTRQILTLSRKQVVQVRPLALNDVVRGVEPFIRRLVSEDVRLDVDARAGGSVIADATQLEQVVLNIALNASHALPQGGAMQISLRDEEVREPRGTSTGTLPAGKYNLLQIIDDGVGMSPETLQRIFEPFFTTKGPERGTGLGLATVYGIVKQFGGEIDVESALGSGTRFRVYLPRTDQEPQLISSTHSRTEGDYRGSEVILVVEDDASVRAPVTRLLRQLGYFVLEAKHGADALTILQEYHAPAHLVITDLVMPEMGGTQLIDLLHSWYPQLKVLYISGYSEELLVNKGALSPGSRYLSKPFSMDALAKTVRELLDRE